MAFKPIWVSKTNMWPAMLSTTLFFSLDPEASQSQALQPGLILLQASLHLLITKSNPYAKPMTVPKACCHFHQEYQRRCDKSAVSQIHVVLPGSSASPAKKIPETGQKVSPVDHRSTQIYQTCSKETSSLTLHQTNKRQQSLFC